MYFFSHVVHFMRRYTKHLVFLMHGQMQQTNTGNMVFLCRDFLCNIFSLFFSIQCCNAKQFNTIFHVMKFDLLQSNSLIKVLWNDLLFHCSVTLFFNSIHVQCCIADRKLSLFVFCCLFFRDLSQ